MNFFEAQETARRNTSWLIFLFLCAVLLLILLTEYLLLGIVAFNQTGMVVFSLAELKLYFSWEIFIAVALGIVLLIAGGSLSKMFSLSSGGPAVAEMLGGQLIAQNTDDFQHRQLLNVVEEMAIAAGMPVPKVYILDEQSINAFAAGKTASNAVIGITQGTLTLLSREELQGVIAHEFSHILNGDMRLNIRLIGLLHGILLIGSIGYLVLHSMRFARSSRSKKGGGAVIAILALGAGLVVIGYAGTFFGQWIKASISRQREYLADSSAVQFTRNKDSIAGALKKIGGSRPGSTLDSPAAAEYSHAYFADGISRFWSTLFATHPPLDQRIKKIDPNWDGNYITPTTAPPESVAASKPTSSQSSAAGIAVGSAILTVAEQAIGAIGTLNEENIEYVQQLMLEIPLALKSAAQSSYSARAVIYAILIANQASKTESFALLNQYADKNMAKLAKALLAKTENLDAALKLPLLELCVNALRELSTNQYIQFERSMRKIIMLDGAIDLNEWVIQRLVLQQLDEHFNFRKPASAKHRSIEAVRASVEIVLSAIAYIEHSNPDQAKQAFDHGRQSDDLAMLNIVPKNALSLDQLDKAFDEIQQLKPRMKPAILKAAAGMILADNKTTTRGIELIRILSMCMDCPMPPLRVSD